MKGKRKTACICAMGVMLTMFFTGCGERDNEGARTPVTITVWQYYNGVQQKAFEQMVEEFNETVGKEQGIFVESYSQGSVEGLLQVVLDAADKKVGAQQMPDICSAYSDTAYRMYTMGLTADIAPFFTQGEKDFYVQGYLQEGEFSPGEMTIFPVAKATEALVLNKTDWDKFSADTGIGMDQLATYDQLVQVAEAYYRWTDSLTPQPDDGKAFFGRDALANMFFSVFRQQGIELFDQENGVVKLYFDKQAARNIWDLFYVPYIKGYYYKGGRFSSDDMSSGQIIAYIGSTSSASYVPKQVMVNDNQGYPIDTVILECPILQDGEKVAIQQGAGMVVLNTGEKELEASIRFLKWFTDSERNVEFTSSAGYLPVTCGTNTEAAFNSTLLSLEEGAVRDMAQVSMEMAMTWTLYTPQAALGGEEIRAVLENSLLKQAQEDREAIMTLTASGMSLEEAQEDYLNGACFEEWYERTKTELESAIR